MLFYMEQATKKLAILKIDNYPPKLKPKVGKLKMRLLKPFQDLAIT